MMTNEAFVVLLAEDSEHDIIATQRAWKKHSIVNPLVVVRDGEECLDYLYRRGRYADPETTLRPKVLLLDLNMPKMDGFAVLKHIRNDRNLRHLPVVVLTTSKAEQDRMESYKLGVNAYIVKPVGFENFADAIRSINLFWELVEVAV